MGTITEKDKINEFAWKIAYESYTQSIIWKKYASFYRAIFLQVMSFHVIWANYDWIPSNSRIIRNWIRELPHAYPPHRHTYSYTTLVSTFLFIVFISQWKKSELFISKYVLYLIHPMSLLIYLVKTFFSILSLSFLCVLFLQFHIYK